MMLFGLFFVVAIVALFALAFAFILGIVRPGSSVKGRVSIAGIGAGFIPTLPAFAALGVGSDPLADGWIPIFAVFGLAVFLTAVIAFPVAYFYTRRSEAKRNPPIKPDVFE